MQSMLQLTDKNVAAGGLQGPYPVFLLEAVVLHLQIQCLCGFYRVSLLLKINDWNYQALGIRR